MIAKVEVELVVVIVVSSLLGVSRLVFVLLVLLLDLVLLYDEQSWLSSSAKSADSYF